MTNTQTYQMRLEFFDARGVRLLESPLSDQDFARAVETTFFDGLRKGRFTEYLLPDSGVRIEPQFASKRVDSPVADSFTVTLPTPDGGEHAMAFEADFLKSLAQRVIVDRVVNGEVEAHIRRTWGRV